jgi:hypothetical protein
VGRIIGYEGYCNKVAAITGVIRTLTGTRESVGAGYDCGRWLQEADAA